MSHAAITHMLKRVNHAKTDSEFTYFYSLLLLGEAVAKLTTLGFIAGLVDDPDRHRYRLEYKILRADGLGALCAILDDSLIGPASQFLLTDLSREKNELTRLCGPSTWQFEAVKQLADCLNHLGISTEPVPTQTDMRRWFALFADLRNKTRGHGATLPDRVTRAAELLSASISTFYSNHALFTRPWAFLYRNLSGKYRITPITEKCAPFEELKRVSNRSYPNGVYLYAVSPRLVPFLESDADLIDFFFPNGGFGKRSFELLSYATGGKRDGDGSLHLVPPGSLPASETQGRGELEQLGRCFSNVPPTPKGYISRTALEVEIRSLTTDDRHAVITLLGRGGIGKTSLALKVVNDLSHEERFDVLLWFSARDVDLQFAGPKPVRPHVLSPEDVSRLYVSLVAPERLKEQGFKCREYFESQLAASVLGPCLYVFDNFETAQSPAELYAWIDTHIRLPSKVLITTRLRDFKGDYPVEVSGMTEEESRALIHTTSHALQIQRLLTEDFIRELVEQAEGHPYVIKILLGEVAKAKRLGHIPRLVAGRDEILTALFERTYASLTPGAQRAFMTLAAWNSAVPRVALEAVLHHAIGEPAEVERAIDTLLQYSLAERQQSVEGSEFLALPLVATVFGRKKLNVSPFQTAIKADVELLQMLGPVNKGEVHFSLERRIEHFLGNVARKIEKGESFAKYAPIVEMMGRNFPPAWVSLARLHMEEGTPEGFEKAKTELRRFLEHDSSSSAAAEAWKQLAKCCHRTNDRLGEVHALLQRSKINSVPFADLSSTANELNFVFRAHSEIVDEDQKGTLAAELLDVMEERRAEAKADDFSQMTWLALRLKDSTKVKDYIQSGLRLDPDHYHLNKLLEQPNVSILME